MRFRLPRYSFAALTACVVLFEATQAQVTPFGGTLVRASHLRTTNFCSRAWRGSMPPSPAGLGSLRCGAIRRREPRAALPYSGCSIRVAWPAIWCAITSSLPDRQGLVTTGSPGVARRPESGRSRLNRSGRAITGRTFGSMPFVSAIGRLPVIARVPRVLG